MTARGSSQTGVELRSGWWALGGGGDGAIHALQFLDRMPEMIPQWSKVFVIHGSSGVMQVALLSVERKVNEMNCPVWLK